MFLIYVFNYVSWLFFFSFSYSAQICVLTRFVGGPCIYSPHSIKIAYNTFLAPYTRCKRVTIDLYFYFSWKSPALNSVFLHGTLKLYKLFAFTFTIYKGQLGCMKGKSSATFSLYNKKRGRGETVLKNPVLFFIIMAHIYIYIFLL